MTPKEIKKRLKKLKARLKNAKESEREIIHREIKEINEREENNRLR